MNAWFQSCSFKKVICQMFSYFIYETSSVNNPTPKQPPKTVLHHDELKSLIVTAFLHWDSFVSIFASLKLLLVQYVQLKNTTIYTIHFTWIRPNSASGDPNCFLETACSQVIPMYNQTIVNDISTALIFNF